MECVNNPLSDWANVATIVAAAVGVIGTIVAIKTYRKDRQDNRHNNELTGMPDFYFTGPNECERFGVSFCHSDGPLVPKIATTCKSQEMVYWFNLINCGKFAAKNVKIAVISQSEYNNIINIPKDRWKNIKYWSGMPSSSSSFDSTDGDLVPLYTAIGDLEIKPNDQELYVLLEYVSSYSNIKYKRLYKWCISSERTTKDRKANSHIFTPIIDRNYDFNEDDMDKNDFDSVAYGKLKKKFETKDGSKTSADVDKQTKAEEEFYRTKNMLTLGQTQLKHNFKKMRLGRPVFLKDVQLQDAANSSETKANRKLRKQNVISAKDWLKLY